MTKNKPSYSIEDIWEIEAAFYETMTPYLLDQFTRQIRSEVKEAADRNLNKKIKQIYDSDSDDKDNEVKKVKEKMNTDIEEAIQKRLYNKLNNVSFQFNGNAETGLLSKMESILSSTEGRKHLNESISIVLSNLEATYGLDLNKPKGSTIEADKIADILLERESPQSSPRGKKR